MSTFDALRIEFMAKTPPPTYQAEVFLSKKVSKESLLKELAKAGYEISERTLNYYISLGIIDSPFIGPKKSGKGKDSYFSPMDFDIIVHTKNMQKKGLSLEEIKKVCVLNKAEYVRHMEQEADHGKRYFITLAKLLIDNLPDTIDEDSLRDYLNIISKPDNDGRHYEYYLSVVLNESEEALKELNAAIEDQPRKDQIHILGMAREIWKTSLDGYYYRMIKPNDIPLKVDVATLNRAIYRVNVVLCYLSSLANSLRYIVNTYFEGNMEHMPNVEKITSRLNTEMFVK